MKTQITFTPDGTAQCLYTEAIPLQEIGRLEITRASTVEFHQSKQEWEVQVNGEVLFSNTSRSVCLEWEQQHFNQ